MLTSLALPRLDTAVSHWTGLQEGSQLGLTEHQAFGTGGQAASYSLPGTAAEGGAAPGRAGAVEQAGARQGTGVGDEAWDEQEKKQEQEQEQKEYQGNKQMQNKEQEREM